jgi:DNA transformation protein
MSVTSAYVDYVLEQVARTGRVTSRRMFGGVGLYSDGQFFGLIADDTLYFKVGEQTRSEYESRGMTPFRPYEDRPEVSMSYFTVPADILDDAEELVAWARKAVAIAAASPKPAKRAKLPAKRSAPTASRKPAKRASARTPAARAKRPAKRK